MSVLLKEEGKEDIMKRAIFLRLPITPEQLSGPLEVVKEYPKGEDYMIAIPRCGQRMAISKKHCF